MTVRAMVSAIQQYSQNLSSKLKRIIIVDHYEQIKRMSKRVQKYQKQTQAKSSINNDKIDFNNDDEQSFVSVFGVPKISKAVSSNSETDDDHELEAH